MRHRFYIPTNLETGSSVILADEELHHARVLRLHEKEAVEVFNGRGASHGGFVETMAKDAIGIRLTAPIAGRESPIALHLAMAIINLDKFELVLQKATELGARSIIPLVTERIEVRAERYRGKGERWQKIIFEAVKQSGRARLPVVESPATFDDVVRRTGTKIVFDADVPPSPPPSHFDAATLFIGPEGGWSEDELKRAHENGCAFARLGPRRLRAETAAIVATALAAARAGDLD